MHRHPALFLLGPPVLALVSLLVLIACQSQDPSRQQVSPPEDEPKAPAPIDTTIQAMSDGGAERIPARYRLVNAGDSLWERALRIHYDAIVIDGHVDTPMRMVDEGYDIGERHPEHRAEIDLPRMEEGGLDAAFFSIYVAPGYGEGAAAVARARQLIREVERQVARYDTLAEMAYTAEDVRRIARSGRKAVLLGLEGGHALAVSEDTLEALYEAGIRYVTLTHVNTNSWADASQSRPRWNGLNERGRALVRAMNRLGVLVDLSHASDSTFYDALAVSEAPAILSHSSMRGLTPNVRNASDEMLRALSEKGGVVMINFFDPLVNQHLDKEVMAEVRRRIDTSERTLHQLWEVIYEVRRERGLPGATLDDVLDHIDHAVEVAGIDHVGLGSDFDGVFDLPAGLQDVTRLPWITYGLLQRDYSEEDLYKILGGNTLRVLKEAVEVSRELQREEATR